MLPLSQSASLTALLTVSPSNMSMTSTATVVGPSHGFSGSPTPAPADGAPTVPTFNVVITFSLVLDKTVPLPALLQAVPLAAVRLCGLCLTGAAGAMLSDVSLIAAADGASLAPPIAVPAGLPGNAGDGHAAVSGSCSSAVPAGGDPPTLKSGASLTLAVAVHAAPVRVAARRLIAAALAGTATAAAAAARRELQADAASQLACLLPGAPQPAYYSPLQIKTASMLAALLGNFNSAAALATQLGPWLSPLGAAGASASAVNVFVDGSLLFTLPTNASTALLLVIGGGGGTRGMPPTSTEQQRILGGAVTAGIVILVSLSCGVVFLLARHRRLARARHRLHLRTHMVMRDALLDVSNPIRVGADAGAQTEVAQATEQRGQLPPGIAAMSPIYAVRKATLGGRRVTFQPHTVDATERTAMDRQRSAALVRASIDYYSSRIATGNTSCNAFGAPIALRATKSREAGSLVQL